MKSPGRASEMAAKNGSDAFCENSKAPLPPIPDVLPFY